MSPDLEPRRIAAGIAAGIIALIPNELLLHVADMIGLATAHGGLLSLLQGLAAMLLQEGWLRSLLPGSIEPLTESPSFQVGFHVIAGIGMAIFYASLIAPNLHVSVLFKGIFYGVVVWLLNAFLVLPATGQGLIGLEHINAAGALWFAVAHFAFFLTLAWAYEELHLRVAKEAK